MRNVDLMEWERVARDYVVDLALARTPMYASVNDLYDAIAAGKLLAPPKIEQRRTGQALCNIFRDVRYFFQTNELVKSTNPHSKERKVYLWEYQPHLDDRLVPFTKSKSFFANAKEW